MAAPARARLVADEHAARCEPVTAPAAAGARSRDGECPGWVLAIQAVDATGGVGNINAGNRRVRQRRGVRRQRLVRWRRWHHAATDGEYRVRQRRGVRRQRSGTPAHAGKSGVVARPRFQGPGAHEGRIAPMPD